MKRFAALLGMLGLALAACVRADGHGAVYPAEITAGDAAGDIFKRSDMTRTTHEDGHVTLDVTFVVKDTATGH